MFDLQYGTVSVVTTNGSPLPLEHWADRITEKIITVAETAPQPLKDQALAFKENIRNIAKIYLNMALHNERIYLSSKLEPYYPGISSEIMTHDY